MTKKVEQEDLSIEYKLESGMKAIAYPGDGIYNDLVKLREEGKPFIIGNDKFFKDIGKIMDKVPWNWKIGISNVNMKLSLLSSPAIPKSFGQEYQFPEISNISSQELGDWLMKLSAWKGYALKLLSKSEVERIILDESYDAGIAKCAAEIDKNGKKVTKDVIVGNAITKVDGFREIKIKLIEKKAEVEGLKRIIDIYSAQLDALSRELSRRGQDIKTIGQGL